MNLGGVPIPPPLALRAKSTNPLLKMSSEAPKIRTLGAKWQLERPNYEPFAQGAPKVRTLWAEGLLSALTGGTG